MVKYGDWVTVYSGRRVWILDPSPEDIDLNDIVHALGNIGRFNGHTSRFYSVLEHSFLVGQGIWKDLGSPIQMNEDQKRLVRTGLLHDASEAYLSDVARPVKKDPQMEFYRQLEGLWDLLMSQKFDLTFPHPAIVKQHDERALMTERRDLLPNAAKSGWIHVTEEPYNDVIPQAIPDVDRLRLRFRTLLDVCRPAA